MTGYAAWYTHDAAEGAEESIKQNPSKREGHDKHKAVTGEMSQTMTNKTDFFTVSD